MPKVVVYVPAAAWKKLQERGLDPAVAVREFARRGYEMNGPVKAVTPSPLPPPPNTSVGAVDDVTEPMAEYIKTRAGGKCQFDTPTGTKCKICGKVHTV